MSSTPQQQLLPAPLPQTNVHQSISLGRDVIAFDGIETYLSPLPPIPRYRAQEEVKDQIMAAYEEFGSKTAQFFNYVVKDGAWESAVDKKSFDHDWARLKMKADEAKTNEQRSAGVAKGIESAWEDIGLCQRAFQNSATRGLLEEVRKHVIQKRTKRDAFIAATQVMFKRLENPTSGQRTTAALSPSDFRTAHREFDELSTLPAISDARLKAQGIFLLDGYIPLSTSKFGLQYPNSVSSSLAPATVTQPGPSGTTDQVGDVEMTAPPRRSNRIVTRHQEQSRPAFEQSAADLEEAENDLDDEHSAYHASRETTAEPAEGEAQEAAAEQEDQKDTCKCNGAVTRAFKTDCARTGKTSQDAVNRLLGKWVSYEEGAHVCFYHTKKVAGKLGLQFRTLNSGQLRVRMQTIHSQIESLPALKTDDNTYRWFRKANRPAHVADSLGTYAFFPVKQSEFTFDSDHVLAAIEQILGIETSIAEEFKTQGTINISGVFKWLYEYTDQATGTTLAELIRLEYDMYDWHARRYLESSDWGWLRSMIHSLTQQLIRQDPLYYMIYCALRPDKCTKLIAYPYYVKYAKAGDPTFFRHIDINLRRSLESDRAAALIQGSVSFTDEDDQNCTQIVPRMHHPEVTQAWMDNLEARGVKLENFIARVEDKHFTREDMEQFGTTWENVPCKAGDVRVSYPQLPHGSTGPATKTRMTMLPWFCKIQDDHETLDCAESNTWSELSASHRDATLPNASPSGFVASHNRIPYRFPATTELQGLSPISDAMLGRRRYDSVAVQAMRDDILGNRHTDLSQYVEYMEKYFEHYRKTAMMRFAEAMILVERAERAAYGEKSFFLNRDNGVVVPPVSDDSPLDEDDAVVPNNQPEFPEQPEVPTGTHASSELSSVDDGVIEGGDDQDEEDSGSSEDQMSEGLIGEDIEIEPEHLEGEEDIEAELD